MGISQKVTTKKQYVQGINEKYSKRDYFLSKQISKYNIKLTPKIFLPKKRAYYGIKNNVGVLWDELEYFLRNDEDFAIEKIEDDSITINALHNEAFHNVFIMAKIIGRIMPLNCELKINVKEYRAESYKDDLLTYYFSIRSDSGNYYKGLIYIKH